MKPSSDSIGGQLTSLSSAFHLQKTSLQGKGNIQVLYALLIRLYEKQLWDFGNKNAKFFVTLNIA